jgi:hypothetical protein
MSITTETLGIIQGVIGLLTILFVVFLYFKKPQEKSELNDALFLQRLDALSRQITKLEDNHLHSLKVKLDDHITSQSKNELMVAEHLTKLTTILEERLPRKGQ